MTGPDDDDTIVDDTEELLPEDGEVANDDDTQADAEDDGGDAHEPEEYRFSDDPEQDAPTDTDLVKHLRHKLREQGRQLAERDKPEAPKLIEVGPRPKLEDFDYDEERHGEAVEAWSDLKVQAKTQQSDADKAKQAADEQWRGHLTRYNQRKAALARPDYQDAEDAVTTSLDPLRQSVIVKGAEDPAKLIYTLGRNPARLAELEKITDPIEFAFAVAKMESKIVTTTRRKAPEPEQIARGSARLSGGGDKEEARLIKESERTGDVTKLVRYQLNKERKK